jgi:hypothetical protein
MSQIYEALRSAEATRMKSGPADRDRLGIMETGDRRQSRRWELDVPLTVYGREPNGAPFYLDAETVTGNADGGMIVLRMPVHEGQDLFLINNWTSQEQMCRVVHVRSRDAETHEVGVSFPSPHPEFWQIPDAPCDLNDAPSDEGF